MISENRIILKNAGHINPAGIDDYIAAGGYSALAKVLKGKPEMVMEEIAASGTKIFTISGDVRKPGCYEVNRLTRDELDPYSKIAPFKLSAVKVTKV